MGNYYHPIKHKDHYMMILSEAMAEFCLVLSAFSIAYGILTPDYQAIFVSFALIITSMAFKIAKRNFEYYAHMNPARN